MLDLIFVINPKESRKIGIPVIETYLCKNTINKNGKYNGGIVRKVNINDMKECNNISPDQIDIIKKFFEKHCYYVTLYQFIINYSDAIKLFEIFKGKNTFYYWNNKNDFIRINKLSIIANYINCKNEISILKNSEMIFDAKSFEVLFKGINKTFSDSLLKKIYARPKLLFYSNKLDECIVKFQYNKLEVNSDSKEKILKLPDNIIARDYDGENKYINILKDIGFKKQNNNKYFYYGNAEKPLLEKQLINNNFKILFINESEKDTNNQTSIKITDSGYDWFDISIYYKNSNKVYDLANKIDLSSNKEYISVDNRAIKLPESIYNQYNKLYLSKDGHLRIAKKNFWSVLDIAYDANQDIRNFTQYDSVSIKLNSKVAKLIKPYQLKGTKWLKWLYVNGLGGCLADDMGLGKTLEVIAMLSDEEIRENAKSILIVVPKSLLSNWKREFEKYSNESNLCMYYGDNRDLLLEKNYRIYITTYNTATNDILYLSNKNFDIVIFDEIQNIKNFKTKGYKELDKLNSKIRIGMSGTPMENSIDELWSILNILNPGMMSSKIKFKRNFSQERNFGKLHKLLTPFILRRTKEEVLNELPKKIEKTIYCDFGEEQRILYDSIREALKKQIVEMNSFDNSVVLKGLLLLREVCCDPRLVSSKVNVNNITESSKLEMLKLKVRELYSNNHKILIFSQYTKMLRLIEEWLLQEELSYFYLDGTTKKRQNVVDNFQRSQKGVFLISLKAGGTGLNLTSAQDVILYDPWWNPFVEKQAEDRAFRLGQSKNVSIYKMIVADSIEEKILSMQNDKKEIFDFILSGISQNKNINLKEIVSLL